jgi:hypothetical protein
VTEGRLKWLVVNRIQPFELKALRGHILRKLDVNVLQLVLTMMTQVLIILFVQLTQINGGVNLSFHHNGVYHVKKINLVIILFNIIINIIIRSRV